MGIVEVVAPDEASRFTGYGAELAEIQRIRAQKIQPTARALHLKAHLGAVGKLVVNAGTQARLGVFESERSWPVYVRFSNGSSQHQSDKKPDVRGFAVKLVGVPGRKIISGLEDAVTQDFLFINDPALPFRDPEEFMAFVRAAQGGPAKLLPRLISGVGFRRAFAILRRAISSPKVTSFAGHTFHTAAPISFGTTAAKLALVPAPSEALPAIAGDDFLRGDLVRRLRAGALSWSLKAQFFVDEQSTPIEDASVVWAGPWTDLGTLTLFKQDPESARGQQVSELVESFSFDPWHSLPAHRPLGAIMRARAGAYRASVMERKAAAEPTTVIEL